MNITTFGEVIMRISPPSYKKFMQSNTIEYTFGGTELNVGIALANFGEEVQHVSAVSKDFLGEAAIKYIRQFGVNVDYIERNDFPIGLYFLEEGASIRPSQISYNRLNASFANLPVANYDWNKIFENTAVFHWTGITPGISEDASIALSQALKAAKERDISVTADPAYRSNLWKFTNKPHEYLLNSVKESTIFIGGINEINELFGTSFTFSDDDFVKACKHLIQACPRITKIVDKTRTSHGANWQKVKGRAYIDHELVTTEEIEIKHVIDRIGTGDAFAAGVIYGLKKFDAQKALEFANATCALKHTMSGDAMLGTVNDVLDIVDGKIQGRIKR